MTGRGKTYDGRGGPATKFGGHRFAADDDTRIGGAGRAFPATSRSLVLEAAREGEDAMQSRAAIAEVYWKPLYVWLRVKWRRSNEDAKDLTQDFFSMLFEAGLLARYNPALGAFRSWIRGCMDNYVRKQDEFAGRQKRGGDLRAVSLDAVAVGSETAEDLFLREWRRQIFQLALEDLESLCRGPELELRHRLFVRYDLAEDPRPGYAALALEFNIPLTSVTNHLAWARRELRRLVMARLEPVTAGPGEARAEAKVLFHQP